MTKIKKSIVENDGSGPLVLQAGSLSMIYDNGMLRSVMFGGVEIVRRFYMALRDEFWNTVPYTIENVNLERSEKGFLLRFMARHEERDVVFSWEGVFEGRNDNSLHLSFDGLAHSTFKRNRIGWCILHPLSLCKGRICRIGKTDGTYEDTAFPGGEIAPWQPFVGMNSIEMTFNETNVFSMRFSGDEFETEDQRNWTDASFKTYSTRADLPVPVVVPAGSRICQEVGIKVAGNPVTEMSEKIVPDLDFSLQTGTRCVIPAIGAMYGDESAGSETGLSEGLSLSHICMAFNRGETDVRKKIDSVKKVCEAVGCPAEVQLFLPRDGWLELVSVVADSLDGAGVPVCRFICLSEETPVIPSDLAAKGAEYLRKRFPGSECIAGGKRYFVDVNRKRSEYPGIDGVCFAATPQVHTFDNRAIMENCEGIGEVAAAAKKMYVDKSVHIVPLSLRPRKQPEKPIKFGGADPRQKTFFAAAWLFALLCYGAKHGLSSVTAENLIGNDGFAGRDGERYPLFHLLNSGVVQGCDARVKIIREGERFIVALRFSLPEEEVLLIANCNGENETVTISGLPGRCEIALLDSCVDTAARMECRFWESLNNDIVVSESGRTTLLLEPYALARITCKTIKPNQ